MNRLNILLAELCPAGVVYKRLGAVATITRGGSFQKKTTLKTASLAFTMVKSTHAMDYL